MTTFSISIENNGDILRGEKVLVELFNENYINIVEISSGDKPSSLGNYEDGAEDDATVDEIISKYSAHTSVQKIKKEFSLDKEFELTFLKSRNHTCELTHIERVLLAFQETYPQRKCCSISPAFV